MARNDIRKITKLGPRSLGVVLPAQLLDALGWREKQKVVVKKERARLIISDWKPKRKK